MLRKATNRRVGVVVRATEGGERRLSASNFIIGQDVIGSKVVTEDGTLLGRVSEAHIGVDQPGVAGAARVVYRVAESTLQKFFGGGFFLPGSVARSYSPEEKRMIVPADTENRYAASSLAEAV